MGGADNVACDVADGRPRLPGGKRQDMASNAEMQQKELQQMTRASRRRGWISTTETRRPPTCMRAKICCWSTTARSGRPAGHDPDSDRARDGVDCAARIAGRGRGTSSAARWLATQSRSIQAPLTTGFARTGYELDVMEARKQRLSYSNAEEATHAELSTDQIAAHSITRRGERQMNEAAGGQCERERMSWRLLPASAARCCAFSLLGAGLELRRQAERGKTPATSCRRCCRRCRCSSI